MHTRQRDIPTVKNVIKYVIQCNFGNELRSLCSLWSLYDVTTPSDALFMYYGSIWIDYFLVFISNFLQMCLDCTSTRQYIHQTSMYHKSLKKNYIYSKYSRNRKYQLRMVLFCESTRLLRRAEFVR